MRLIRRDVWLAVIAGFAVALTGSYLLHILGAMPLPVPNAPGWLYTVWDIFFVQLLGIDILAGLAAFLLIKFTRTQWIILSAIMFVCLEMYIHLLAPFRSQNMDFAFQLGFEDYYPQFLVLVFILLGAWVGNSKR